MCIRDRGKVAYSISKEDGNMDLVVFDLDRKEPIRISTAEQVDYRPVWHSNSEKITYTSHSNMTPNFHTVDINTKKITQNTNIGDAVWTVGWNYEGAAIIGLTLGDVDSARVVDIDPNRVAKNNQVYLNPSFSKWKNKKPDLVIPDLDSIPDIVDSIPSQKYIATENIKHLGTILLPDITGLFYNGAFSDVTGRNIITSAIFSIWQDIYGTLGYLTATGKPICGFWGFNYYKDIFFEERIYNQNNDYLFEIYNGLELFGYRNHNFGKSLSSNHNIRYGMKFFNRKVVVEPDSLDVFSNAIPESGKEGSISLIYTFTNKRPNINNMYVPRNGYGIQLEGNLIDKNIWGDFSYKHYNIDAYINKGLGPATLYLRGRYEKISGQPPAQETAGLVDIPTNYYAGQFVLGKEHMSPRGWEGANLGDRAFMGTAEIRSPLIDLSLFEILKIVKAGKLSFAYISDFGRVWGSQNSDWVATAGVEGRLALIFGNMPVVIYSMGIAQTFDQWSENPNAEGIGPYVRLALVNPF